MLSPVHLFTERAGQKGHAIHLGVASPFTFCREAGMLPQSACQPPSPCGIPIYMETTTKTDR
jgi:hypothetical protein